MEEERMTLSRKELKRLDLTKRFLRKELKRKTMAKLLGISERQATRVAARVREDDEKGVVHKGRNRKSNNRYPDEIRKKVLKLCREQYVDFGPTLAVEVLEERDNVVVSRETLRKWFQADGVAYKKRKHKPHRQWRERKACFGEMVQLDGSTHAWFEGRGPKCTLMGYIDDATGTFFGRFYEYEGSIPAMDSFRRYTVQNGLPASVYLDRHSTYKSPGTPTLEEEMNGEGPLSQFERAMKELGVRLIHARSPQAKGRVERLFETCQDRLVKKMRLAGVSNIEEGNVFLEKEYLKDHNSRYAREARKKEDLHGPKPGYQEMLRILSLREERVVRKDSTIWYEGRVYLLKGRTWSRKVVVEERLDGKLIIRDRNHNLPYRDITSMVKRRKEKKSPTTKKGITGTSKVRQARLTFR